MVISGGTSLLLLVLIFACYYYMMMLWILLLVKKVVLYAGPLLIAVQQLHQIAKDMHILSLRQQNNESEQRTVGVGGAKESRKREERSTQILSQRFPCRNAPTLEESRRVRST